MVHWSRSDHGLGLRSEVIVIVIVIVLIGAWVVVLASLLDVFAPVLHLLFSLLPSPFLPLSRTLRQGEFSFFVSQLILKFFLESILIILVVVGFLTCCPKLQEVASASPGVEVTLLPLGLIGICQHFLHAG